MKKRKLIFVSLGFFAIFAIILTITGKNMHQFELSVTVNKSVDRVFTEFMNAEQASKWIKGFKSFEQISGKPGEVGAKFKMNFDENGKTIEFIETVTEIESNKKFSFEMSHEMMISSSNVSFENLGADTKIISKIVIRPQGFTWKILMPFMISHIKKRQQEDLIRFKKVVEG